MYTVVLSFVLSIIKLSYQKTAGNNYVSNNNSLTLLNLVVNRVFFLILKSGIQYKKAVGTSF